MASLPSPISLFSAIYTAAMEMLGGGSEVAKQCRKPEIMADAAYIILTQDSRAFTGNFCIDDEVLLQNGLKDVSIYDCVPGQLTFFFTYMKTHTHIHTHTQNHVSHCNAFFFFFFCFDVFHALLDIVLTVAVICITILSTFVSITVLNYFCYCYCHSF